MVLPKRVQEQQRIVQAEARRQQHRGLCDVELSSASRDRGYARRVMMLHVVRQRPAGGRCRRRHHRTRHTGEAIAAIEGVDGIFIGPGDLHASMGYTGETANPKMQPIYRRRHRRIRQTGKAPGILIGDEQLAQRYIEVGALFTAVGADIGILARGADQLAERFKQ